MIEEATNRELDEFDDLLDELLDLRRAVATVLGREQYVYHVLDRAIENRFAPAMRGAIDEFRRQPDDLQCRVRHAV
jgi:hypothetical protein